jgi:cytochrome c oxidase assembly protein subunit 15
MTRRSFNWPHAIACLLVAVTAVLLSFGALVTTYEAAMAVPDWPGTYGHNMFLFPWAAWFHGPWDLFLEHGHRLLGAATGIVTLILAAVAWRGRASTAVRWLAVAAVALVVVQGLLGGARVLLDDKTVAKVHACTGPLFFAVAVAIATATRPQAAAGPRRPATIPPAPREVVASTAAPALVIASYLQLVAGAQLRHMDATVDPFTFRWLVGVHVAGAVVVAAVAVAAAWANATAAAPTRGWSRLIAGLIAAQVLLGCGAWVASWGLPSGLLPADWLPARAVVARSTTGAMIVTGHVLLGMAILGSSVVLWIVGGGLAARGGLRPLPGDAELERAFA